MRRASLLDDVRRLRIRRREDVDHATDPSSSGRAGNRLAAEYLSHDRHLRRVLLTVHSPSVTCGQPPAARKPENCHSTEINEPVGSPVTSDVTSATATTAGAKAHARAQHGRT